MGENFQSIHVSPEQIFTHEKPERRSEGGPKPAPVNNLNILSTKTRLWRTSKSKTIRGKKAT